MWESYGMDVEECEWPREGGGGPRKKQRQTTGFA
jgi:hypothetical protein